MTKGTVQPIEQAINALKDFFADLNNARPEDYRFAPLANEGELPEVCTNQASFETIDVKDCKPPVNCSKIDGGEERFHRYANNVRLYKDVTWDQLKENYPDQIFKGKRGDTIPDATIDRVYEPIACIEYIDIFQKGTVQYMIAWRLDDKLQTAQEGIACTFRNRETGNVIAHEAKGKQFPIDGSTFDRIVKSALAYFGCVN